ncbi:nucleotide exchange factor GrpE [Streptomyces sp. NPDC088354]|uniref:nucleotide exchange factor GrpE n=1 Tax=Streptomyces sp. NPDC088354 TaxID=3365856 RepID=UPI0037F538C2
MNGAAPPEGAGALRARLAERTADLKRLKAEYDNYRKRVHRDRLAVREIAVANVLRGLLPVLDAVDRARELGEVTQGFGAVAEVLETRLGELGLQSFGTPGDPFDPVRHEAVGTAGGAESEGPVCAEVVRPGYRVGGHLLRPAEVVVARPAPRRARVHPGGMETTHKVDVAPLAEDHRYRRVHLRGVGWQQFEREEFELRVRDVFPDIDVSDPQQVHWADHPGEWPDWRPGEA